MVVLDPGLNLREPLACSEATDEQICDLEEDGDQAAAHCEVVVFECVPLGPGQDVLRSVDVDHHLVRVHFRHEPVLITISHRCLALRNQILACSLNIINELLRVRLITHALKELNAFLSFQLFQSPVFN